MSNSHRRNTSVLLIILSLALAVAGCGGDPKPSAGQAPEQAPEDLSGSLSGEHSGSDTVQPAAPENRDDSAPEATDFAPVDVRLEDGSFARNTPSTIHVPSGFMLIVTASADDHGPYKLSFISPVTAQTFKIKSNATSRLTFEALSEGQTAKLVVAGKTVKVKADAEPGP